MTTAKVWVLIGIIVMCLVAAISLSRYGILPHEKQKQLPNECMFSNRKDLEDKLTEMTRKYREFREAKNK